MSSVTTEVPGKWVASSSGITIWWWILGLLVAIGLVTVFYWFVGTVMLGLFFYYTGKPIVDRLSQHLPRGLAVPLALLLVVLPFLLTTVLVVLAGLGQLASVQPADAGRIIAYLFPSTDVSTLPTTPGELISAIRNFSSDPSIQGFFGYAVGVFGVFTNALFHIMIALAMGFYLLRDDRRIERWFRANVAAEDTAGYRFLSTVNSDLKSVYFVELTIIAIAIIVTGVVYQLWNLVVPSALVIPQPLFVAVVTGTASILPLVGRGIVYLSVTAYLALVAFQIDPTLLVYPVGFVILMFGVVDNFLEVGLRPRLAGRHVHSGIMLFAYVLGVALFGWYGVFYGPFLVIVGVEFLRLVFPDLIGGTPLSIPPRAEPPAETPPPTPSDEHATEPKDEPTVDGDEGESPDDGDPTAT